ncbi:MAG TPA: hypothetical protein DCE14_05420 [Kosmotogaceae bacterium]|nr:MAG: Uncharacterized protein XE05_0366 [Thermotogales bacterium 46_20]HAA85777.1 hypothetical protein [Kosmotogaceae bacterium]
MDHSVKAKLISTATVLLVVVALVSCGPRTEPVTPGRLVGFQPDGYAVESAEVILAGRIDGLVAEDSVILKMVFLRGQSYVEMSVAQFDGSIDATSFWYSWTREVAGPVRSAFSAFPLIYGELSGEYGESYVKAWFQGRWLYVFRGEKIHSEDIAEQFKDYKRAVERSIEL